MHYDPECVFCRIIHKEAPASIVDESRYSIAFTPLNPVVEGHVLVVPKTHVENFMAAPGITGLVASHAARYAVTHGDQYNLITSAGEAATQTVFHLHIHLVPRRAGDGLPLPWTGQQGLEHP